MGFRRLGLQPCMDAPTGRRYLLLGVCLLVSDAVPCGTSTSWWCVCRNNQWALAGEIDPDPRKSSFYLAMELCDYVLLVLDENGTPFTRIWSAVLLCVGCV